MTNDPRRDEVLRECAALAIATLEHAESDAICNEILSGAKFSFAEVAERLGVPLGELLDRVATEVHVVTGEMIGARDHAQ